jgi:hypothetical protein
VRRLAPALLVVVALAACSEGDPGGDGDVESLGDLVPAPLADELTESGRCVDGRLWASADDGSTAVTITPGPDGMPAEAVLPTEAVEVSVLHGDDPCGAGAEGSPGIEGRVEVDRPTEECGPTSFRIDGLEAADGTTFGPIEGRDDAEACVSG